MKDLKIIKTEGECTKEGCLWDNGTCKALTLENVMKTDIETFCKAAKGDLFKRGNKISIGNVDGIETAIESICGFEGLHISNDRDETKWAPNIPKMTGIDETWYLTHLTEAVLGCAKNDPEKVIGTHDEIKEYVLEELEDDERKSLSSLDLEKMIEKKIESEMEFQCEDIWREAEKNGEECLTGLWEGDTQDNYDIGETEQLYTNANLTQAVKDVEDIEDEDFDEKSTMGDFHPIENLTPGPRFASLHEKAHGIINRFDRNTHGRVILYKSALELSADDVQTTPFNANELFADCSKLKYPSIKDGKKLITREQPTDIRLKTDGSETWSRVRTFTSGNDLLLGGVEVLNNILLRKDSDSIGVLFIPRKQPAQRREIGVNFTSWKGQPRIKVEECIWKG